MVGNPSLSSFEMIKFCMYRLLLGNVEVIVESQYLTFFLKFTE